MRTIILPGYSLHNKEWAEEAVKNLTINTKDEIFIHEWRHWSKKAGLSIKYEVGKIVEEIGKDKVNIIAKSVGTMVTMHILQRIGDRIEKIILCGIPSVSTEREKLFASSLLAFPSEKIICFQNKNDPFTSYKEVRKFMLGINPKIKVFEKPRSDHHYPYYKDFQNFIS